MIKVNWKSRILSLIQPNPKDNKFFAFQETHKGLEAIKSTVEGIKISPFKPVEPVNGTNKNFRMSNEPAFIVVNGVVMVSGVDFTWKNGWVQFVNPPPNQAVVRGYSV